MNKKYTALYAVIFLFFILPAQAQGQYFTVYGQVFDIDSTPVNGVTVSLSVGTDTISTITTTATLYNGTNVDGIYYLDLGNLPVSVSAGTLMNLTATTTGKSASQTVARAAIEPQRIDLYLSTGAPTFNISGYKLNDTGAGLPGWKIMLLNVSTGNRIKNATTNATGYYEFKYLANGSYNVAEEMQAGWTNISAAYQIKTIAGADITNVNFRNKQVQVMAPSGAPAITGWNNKTNDANLSITVNVSETVRFNASANQSITTWNWFLNGVNQSNNFDNFSAPFASAGTYTVKVNATNANGTSNTITWNITVLSANIVSFTMDATGNRSGWIFAHVNVTNFDKNASHWFVIDVSGVAGNGSSLIGYPLVGTATVWLNASGSPEDRKTDIPVVITIPPSAATGPFNLVAGIWKLDEFADPLKVITTTIQQRTVTIS